MFLQEEDEDNPSKLEDQLKVYEIYVDRVKKEADLMWSRFKIYFGFVSGILIIIGYIIWPHFETREFIIPKHFSITIILLSFAGIIFSIFWYLINENSKGWQNLMNHVIQDVEDYIFDNHYLIYFIFTLDKEIDIDLLNKGIINKELMEEFANKGHTLSKRARITRLGKNHWKIENLRRIDLKRNNHKKNYIIKYDGSKYKIYRAAKKYGLYQRIDSPEAIKLHQPDVTDVNNWIAWTFCVVFIIIAILFSFILFN